MVKTIGYIILVLSCTLFCLIPVVQWFDFTKSQIAGMTAGLIIAGEILFYLSILILGKAFYAKLKEKFKFWKGKKNENNVV